MKEFKGTRGEWIVKHSESKTAYNVIGTVLGGRYKIARCPYIQDELLCDTSNKLEKKEAEANARLIATAPELLNALQLLMKAIRERGYAGLFSTELHYADITTSKALGTNE